MAVGVILALTCSAGASAVSAQDDSLALADGTYSGSVSFTGGFSSLFSVDGGSANIAFDGVLNGPANMNVSGGEVTGDWSMAGTSTTAGALTGVADGVSVTFVIDGTGTYDGVGTFEGTSTDARMVGTLGGLSTVTVSSDFFSNTSDDSEPSEVDLALTDPIGDCGRAFARLDLTLNNSIEQVPGFESQIIGVFSGADPAGSDLYFTEVELLNDRIAALWNRVADPIALPVELIDEAFALIRDVEAAEDAWVADACTTKPDFANALTLLTASVIERVLSDVENGGLEAVDRGVLVEQSLELGLRSGALGSGTKIRARAMAIAERAEAALADVFDEVTTGPSPSQFLANETALAAEQYGWTLTNSAGVTSTDFLTTIGSE